MRIARSVRLCCVIACAACGHSAKPPDTAIDASGDPPIDAGDCGADRLVTGELLDLDSARGAQFKGVAGAKLAVEGLPATAATTAGNGRFSICAPAAAAITLDVDAPGDYLDGKLYIEAEAIDRRPLSLRTYTRARAATLYTFDPSRGHVLVYLAGDRSDLTLDRPHDPPLGASDDDGDGVFAWEPGPAGRYVLFPNVDVSSPTATLGRDLSGPHTIPVAAGQLTLAAIFFVYL